MFDIKFNYVNGGVDVIRNTEDKYKMNWVEGANTWGVIKNSETVSVMRNKDGITAVYRTPHLLVTVERSLVNGIYKENYTFESAIGKDVFCKRGDVGIYTTFNDNYEAASVSLTERCNTHIWCGGNTSYINAVKMGPFPYGLGLVLTKGSLDTYSIERSLDLGSADRGDFILHPSMFKLKPGEKMCVEWEMFWYDDGKFRNALEKYNTAILIDARNYTVYSDEKIKFSVNRKSAKVFLDGAEIITETKNGRTYAEYVPARTGHHEFIIQADGIRTKAEFFVQIPFRELARKRAEFITQKQQYHCEGSALDGAYLIYDNQDKCLIFDELWSDYNASRERLVMGLFIAKYLQYDHDPKIYKSLMDYYKFVTREFYDEETGEVYNDIGKDPTKKRLYNAPWMSVFVMEMYNLTKDPEYLNKMYKLLEVYYSIGGENFYPNGLSLYESVEALKKEGMNDKADKLTKMYRKHVDNIIRVGYNYPEHEVVYEQTIVTPAVLMIAQMYMIDHDEKLIEECKKHIKILERFNGAQPSHYLNDLAIRYWDAYWFGKRKICGDTFPHSASVHTSNGFLHYAMISGDEEYRKRAVCGARNNLSVYETDGSAHCTRVHPLTVNGRRGEFYDEFANEQDGFLYYMIKFFGALDVDGGSNETDE